MQVLLLSTYELGRPPFGLASAAAWLRAAGCEVTVRDLSRDPLPDVLPADLALVAVHLPMHTATRLAVPVFDRLRALAPGAHRCAFGLYAPITAPLLREHDVHTILGPEFEPDLAALVRQLASTAPAVPVAEVDPGGPCARGGRPPLPRVRFCVPDRSGMPPLDRYAQLHTASAPGHPQLAGYTEASRGCKHRCRHCPIVPVYDGRFRVVPLDVVLADIAGQVRQGAAHITFGDPDFFNGIGHARAVVEAVAREFPGLGYDVTIKVEHLLRHAGELARLAATGCRFVTSAVESIDDAVLARLAKGHTRADAEHAVARCAEAGVMLSPTFIAFTPWTSVRSYLDLLDWIAARGLVDHVAPVQLALRLLVPEGSLLRDLPEVRELAPRYDASALVYPWAHPDPAVDALQRDVAVLVAARSRRPRAEVFAAVREVAWRRAAVGEPGPAASMVAPGGPGPVRSRIEVAWLDEPWYC